MVVSTGTPGTHEEIGGVKIALRETAQMPVPGDPSKKAPIKTVDLVILEDERELYQCVYPETDCYLGFTGIKSATSHQRIHSPKTKARRLAQEAEKARVAKAAETTRRRSGSTAGAVARQARLTEVEQLGLPDALRREAGILEERASWLRAMAATADQWGKTVNVSPEELQQLRDDAAQWRQLRGMLGK